MSTTSRRPVRIASVLTAIPVALTLGAMPAAGAPFSGEPTGTGTPAVVWGWPDGEGPAYPGQRFGVGLPAELRGPVLEFGHR